MALKGIRVLELAGLAPAPFCGMILSDFGATVIRVDKKAESFAPDRLSRGKKSVIINLKSEEGKNLMKQMCQKADVLIEPFRPGVMEKLGLGPEVLLQTNPKLIYARLTGYGQTGTMAKKAGHDINYIAMSGALSKFGRKNERPYPPVNVAADFAGGGAVCALGIVISLYERSISGKGQIIDANMVEGSAYIACWIDCMKELLFQQPRGSNMLDGGAAFYDTYETKDGKYVAIGALEPQFYKDLLKGLGISGVSQADDQEQQRKLFGDIIKTKSRDEWTKTFEHLDACFTPILSSEEAAVHPHNSEKGSFLRGTNPELMSGPAPRLSRTPEIREQRPLPEKGEHTMEVLLEMGFSQQELKHLVSNGAICVNSNV